jgi:kinesin family protein 20
MRCAVIEAETREEVMKEMEDRMRNMETLYTRRLMNEVGVYLLDILLVFTDNGSQVKQNEIKTDAKIDLLHRSRLGEVSPVKGHARGKRPAEKQTESDIEMSLVCVALYSPQMQDLTIELQ